MVGDDRIPLRTYLILLELSSANFGLTRSSPNVIYNLTIQNTAAFRTIDCVSSVRYFSLLLLLSFRRGQNQTEKCFIRSIDIWHMCECEIKKNVWRRACTFAIFGITLSKCISVILSPWYDTNSNSNLIAHKLVGNSPVAMTGFKILMVPSTGSTAAIRFRISSILTVTCAKETNHLALIFAKRSIDIDDFSLVSYVFMCPIAIDDFEQNQFKEIAPTALHFFAAQNFRQCMQNGHDDVRLLGIEQR